MKKFTIELLSVIFVALIAGSIQSISADHLEPGQGIFKDKEQLNYTTTKDSKYQIYLQSIIRNESGNLISVVESNVIGAYVPHKLTDHVFDTLMGKKEIITIDNIKYEKVQYTFNPTLEQRAVGIYPIFAGTIIKFNAEGDAIAQMNEERKDYAIWKIHYCATFEGHGFSCIPIFQVLVSTMTLEPHDVITQQWTILRELN